ncbi:acyltransferase [Nostoc sp. XA013]|nr:acyltransferase [Nostoc sp. XA013]
MSNKLLSNILEKKSKNQRDIRFDILKTIGLFCIIFAHIGPENSVFFHLRRFDVPLMVVVSGALYAYSSGNKQISFWSYVKKRLPRLIAPVWLFLIFYFIATYIIFSFLSKPYPFSSQKILETFLLLKGIGYVWIIRVFTLMALFANFSLYIYRLCKSEVKFLTLLSLTYLGYEFLLILTQRFSFWKRIIFLDAIINDYLFYLLPYGCLFGLGMIIPKLRSKSILLIAGLFLSLFLLQAVYFYHTLGHFISNENFKYPAKSYYVSYGVFMSMLVYFIVDKLSVKHNLLERDNLLIRLIVFISSSSLWIYLWHIFFVYYWQNLIAEYLPELTSNFTVSFLVVAFGAIAITYLQKQAVFQVIAKTKVGQKNSDSLSILFLK